MTTNLEYLKVFYQTARLGSLTKAAKALAISQPAVSQSLKQLEMSLGVSLFQRQAKGVKLTDEGEVFYSYVKKGYEQMEQGIARLRQMQNLECGQVHIGASDMTLRFYLLPFLEKFHQMYPDIKVMVTNAPTPETLALLQEGKIDFGVVSAPFASGEGIEVRKVQEIRDVFVAGNEFGQYRNRILSYEELETLPLICLENNTSTRKYVDKYLEGQGVVLCPEFELATSDMIVHFARRNLGVGCVVADFAREALEEGELFEIELERQIPERNICVVTDVRAVHSTAARKLLQIMEEEV